MPVPSAPTIYFDDTSPRVVPAAANAAIAAPQTCIVTIQTDGAAFGSVEFSYSIEGSAEFHGATHIGSARSLDIGDDIGSIEGLAVGDAVNVKARLQNSDGYSDWSDTVQLTVRQVMYVGTWLRPAATPWDTGIAARIYNAVNPSAEGAGTIAEPSPGASHAFDGIYTERRGAAQDWYAVIPVSAFDAAVLGVSSVTADVAVYDADASASGTIAHTFSPAIVPGDVQKPTYSASSADGKLVVTLTGWTGAGPRPTRMEAKINGRKAADVAPDAQSFEIDGLAFNTPMRFWLYCTNDAGASGQSAASDVTVESDCWEVRSGGIVARGSYDPDQSHDVSRPTDELVWFDGIPYPYPFGGTAVEERVSLGNTFEGDADLAALQRIVRERGGVGVYRGIDGAVWPCKIGSGVSYDYLAGGWRTGGIEITRIAGDA